MEGLLFLSGQYYGIMKKSCMSYKNSPFKTWVQKLFPFFGFQNDMDNTVLLYSPEGRKSEGNESSQFFSTVTRKT